MLSINNLSVHYGGIRALRGISLDVPAGKIVTLIGANGAGKSTTLNSIMGLVKVGGGTVSWNGADITGAKTKDIVESGIVLVPEGRRVFPNLTVDENLTLGASYSYTDGKYTKVIDAQTGAIITGRPFAFLAKHRLNLSANLAVPLADNVGELGFGVNWAYSSKYSLSVTADPLGTENGYNQLDLRVDWNNLAGQEGLSIGAFVNNVTKETYKIGGVPIYTTLGTTSLLYSEPRTWGVQLRYRFGD